MVGDHSLLCCERVALQDHFHESKSNAKSVHVHVHVLRRSGVFTLPYSCLDYLHPPSPLPSTPHLPSSVVLRVWEDAKVQVAYGSSPPEDVATTKQLTPISDLLKTAMELQTKTTKVCKEVLNVFFLQMSTPFSSFLHHLCLF